MSKIGTLPGAAAALRRPRPARRAQFIDSGWLPALVGEWRNRRAYRAALARLDEHLLCDIGLEPGQAQAEAAKPFWQP